MEGPARRSRKGIKTSSVRVDVDQTTDDSVTVLIEGQSVLLRLHEWSPILPLSFKLGRFVTVRAVTRVTLTQLEPEIMLYALPLQIHPLQSTWRYASPKGFVKDAWERCGPFLTLGWPQDTTGLEEGCMTDEQFLKLCESVTQARECILMPTVAARRSVTK